MLFQIRRHGEPNRSCPPRKCVCMKQINVEATIPHPKFSSALLEDDIDLLRLQSEVTFDGNILDCIIWFSLFILSADNIWPICVILNDSVDLSEIQNFTIWKRKPSGVSSDFLHTFRPTRNSWVVSFYTFILSDKPFCAGKNVNHTGDTGAPLAADFTYQEKAICQYGLHKCTLIQQLYSWYWGGIIQIHL